MSTSSTIINNSSNTSSTRNSKDVIEVENNNDKEEPEPECSICMDAISIKGTLSCDHIFCYSCIFDWSKQENSCPLCKKKFKEIKKVDPSKKTKKGKVLAAKSVKIKEKSQGNQFRRNMSINMGGSNHFYLSIYLINYN
jgi:hypothetical protein